MSNSSLSVCRTRESASEASLKPYSSPLTSVRRKSSAPQLAVRLGERRLDRLGQPLGAQWLLGLDRRLFDGKAQALAEEHPLPGPLRPAEQHSPARLARDEAVGVLRRHQAVLLLQGGQGRADQQAVDPGDDDMTVGLLIPIEQLARRQQADRAADPGLGPGCGSLGESPPPAPRSTPRRASC